MTFVAGRVTPCTFRRMVLAVLAARAARIDAQEALPGPQNFDTYLTQRAAGSRLQPVSAGHPI